MCGLGEEGKIDVGSDGRLLEGSLENGDSRGFVGERDVDELIESSRSKKSRIELIGSVGGSDDEDVLLGSDSVHLGLNERAKGRKGKGREDERSAKRRRAKIDANEKGRGKEKLTRIWFRTLSPAPPASPPPDPPRDFAMESNSSKNMTHGEAARALSKTSLTLASDSPNHMVRSSGPLIEMKFCEGTNEEEEEGSARETRRLTEGRRGEEEKDSPPGTRSQSPSPARSFRFQEVRRRVHPWKETFRT